jgi:hypothetical protein
VKLPSRQGGRGQLLVTRFRHWHRCSVAKKQSYDFVAERWEQLAASAEAEVRALRGDKSAT